MPKKVFKPIYQTGIAAEAIGQGRAVKYDPSGQLVGSSTGHVHGVTFDRASAGETVEIYRRGGDALVAVGESATWSAGDSLTTDSAGSFVKTTTDGDRIWAVSSKQQTVTTASLAEVELVMTVHK